MRSRLRPTVILTAAALAIHASHALAQTVSTPPIPSTSGFRVAGTVVSKVDGQPLANAHVALASTQARQQPMSVTTSDDGKFEFTGIPAGKYSLNGAKRGFLAAGYEQHDQYSTAIVTGAGLDTQHLVLKLNPESLITGRVLDESGEPVRDATVSLYRDNHFEGIHQIQTFRGARTNDLGEFEIPNLMPGTYFLSASAQPWYAVHAPTEARPTPETFDRSLDVAYPLTYYGDATDPESATPISLHGGEHVQTEIHMNPVPSLHLIVHVPDSGNHQFPFPQFEQPAFDGSIPVEKVENRMITPGTWEVSGLPAGKYDIHLMGQNGNGQINGVAVDSSTQELDTSTAEPMCSLQVSVSFKDANPSERYGVMLRGKSARITMARNLDSKGQAEFEKLAPGHYEVFVFSMGSQFSIGRIAAEGATVTGHTITLTPGASASLSISAVKGAAEIEGVTKKSGKPFAGAMVVLVPHDPENNRDLFRRDQSDLDGTFVFHNVIPGSYSAVAIENGWDLDWGQPELIAAYAKGRVPIQVGDKPRQSLSLSAPLEVQQK